MEQPQRLDGALGVLVAGVAEVPDAQRLVGLDRGLEDGDLVAGRGLQHDVEVAGEVDADHVGHLLESPGERAGRGRDWAEPYRQAFARWRLPEALLASKQVAATVNSAIEALSDDLRQAITLREIDGLSYEEVATALGVPVSTVRGRIARARRDLAERMASWQTTRD